MNRHVIAALLLLSLFAVVLTLASDIDQQQQPLCTKRSGSDQEEGEGEDANSECGEVNEQFAEGIAPRPTDVWDEKTYDPTLYSDRCDIEQVHAADLSRKDFEERYLEKKPVIILNATDIEHFRLLTQRHNLEAMFGDSNITLSSANRHSYTKKVATLREYLNSAAMKPADINVRGNDTMIHFGDNKHEEWEDLFRYYKLPNQYIFDPTALSFGLAGSGTGVPLHTHSDVLAEVFYGMKRWFIAPPGEPGPRSDPDASSLQWFRNVYSTYSEMEKADILECVCKPGMLLYIPSFWHHGTLNIGQTVFMSVFL